jgi:hypothetical protein
MWLHDTDGTLAFNPPVTPCSELEKRKSGEPGRFVLDDPVKYPAKDDIGFFGESSVWFNKHCLITHSAIFGVLRVML